MANSESGSRTVSTSPRAARSFFPNQVRPSIVHSPDMIKDLRHAVRTLLHAKGWTAVVVISLALGIGANTALFSAINGLYLRKLPVKDPDTLVRFRHAGRNDMSTSSSDYGPTRFADGSPGRSTVSFAIYQQFL